MGEKIYLKILNSSLKVVFFTFSYIKPRFDIYFKCPNADIKITLSNLNKILSNMALRRPVMNEFDSLSLTEIGARFKYNLEDTICWCRAQVYWPNVLIVVYVAFRAHSK